MAFFVREWRTTIFRLLVLLSVYAVIFLCLKLPQSDLDRGHEAHFAAEMARCAATSDCHEAPRQPHQPPDEETVMRNLSAACPNAVRHGFHQKVISFVYFGNRKPWRLFLEGVAENAKLADQLYPDWRIRIYHSMPERHRSEVVLRDAACCYENIDLCPLTPPIGKLTMLWRIFPMADPSVDVFVSRDLDSRISQREVDAVKEWLTDDSKVFHLMRDHRYHTAMVMGGMWGAKVNAMRSQLAAVVQRILTNQRQDLMDDQEVLAHYMEPLLQDRTMQHDSFYCANFTFLGGMRPFPSARNFIQPNFVGGVFFDYTSDECPLQCRPPDQQYWEYC